MSLSEQQLPGEVYEGETAGDNSVLVDGVRVHKRKLLRDLLSPDVVSADRHRRVRHVSRFVSSSNTVPDGDLRSRDVVAALCTLQRRVVLVVCMVHSLFSKGHEVIGVDEADLTDAIKVMAQPLQLAAHQDTLIWGGGLTLGAAGICPEVCEFRGDLVRPLCPEEVSIDDQHFFSFDIAQLQQLCYDIWAAHGTLLRRENQLSPTVHPAFVYMNRLGDPAFCCYEKAQAAERVTPTSVTWACKVCEADVRQEHMRQHVGYHILCADPRLSHTPMTCGFCGESGGDSCVPELVSHRKTNVVSVKCDCSHFHTFTYSCALKVTSKCTNVPVACSVCDNVFWKYNMSLHWSDRHAGEGELPVQFVVDVAKEKDLLKKARIG
eukprot:GHVU01018181.1.p1 GENE.GHVU01018181.1~~GHVU01018181.1.p1  ORF type:complete len:378 (+),score=27.89 GHVU01018181.1:1223-2356(+)